MAKILIVETNVDKYENADIKTGIWLEEITNFYDVVKEAGYDVDFASVKGGFVPVDPASANADERTLSILNDEEFNDKAIQNTLKISDVNPADYMAIYYGGGHGVVWDFPDDEDLQNVAQTIYKNGGYISSVCHGEVGLINLKDENGESLIKGKKINGFTNEEEAINGTDEVLPYLAETELIKKGAIFVKGEPFTEFVANDERFITGQNPFSSRKVAEVLVEELNK